MPTRHPVRFVPIATLHHLYHELHMAPNPAEHAPPQNSEQTVITGQADTASGNASARCAPFPSPPLPCPSTSRPSIRTIDSRTAADRPRDQTHQGHEQPRRHGSCHHIGAACRAGRHGRHRGNPHRQPGPFVRCILPRPCLFRQDNPRRLTGTNARWFRISVCWRLTSVRLSSVPAGGTSQNLVTAGLQEGCRKLKDRLSFRVVRRSFFSTARRTGRRAFQTESSSAHAQ